MRREWQNPGLTADTETGVGSGNRDASSRVNMTSRTFQMLDKVGQHHDPVLMYDGSLTLRQFVAVRHDATGANQNWVG